MHPLLPALQKGLADLGLTLADEQQTQLLAYMDLIGKWTKVYNLTAVRDANEMLTHHLLDSLAVIAPLRRELAKLTQAKFSLLDVGAGAGLPGIVIAITCPEVSVTCVDTVAKKAAFIGGFHHLV
jgi:16S rRNA (guanine527-N7)-methyltransferase